MNRADLNDVPMKIQRQSEHNDNCAKCFGRGFVWRYNKKSQTATPCQRCRASGIEPAKKSRRKQGDDGVWTRRDPA